MVCPLAGWRNLHDCQVSKVTMIVPHVVSRMCPSATVYEYPRVAIGLSDFSWIAPTPAIIVCAPATPPRSTDRFEPKDVLPKQNPRNEGTSVTTIPPRNRR